ncbi:hypothetical protein [Cupriavidus sp. RAF12]|uniref:hypothetical protein n=1 Tax=Cupriavidus sp. RAF12 TaxID=3233050 RepID=UPI003F8FCBCE
MSRLIHDALNTPILDVFTLQSQDVNSTDGLLMRMRRTAYTQMFEHEMAALNFLRSPFAATAVRWGREI